MRRTQLLCFAMALLVPSLALADSITPENVNVSINVGDTVRIVKTLTVDGRNPSSQDPVDILFLFDTSESMRANYTNPLWQNGSIPAAIVAAASGVGQNVQVGVASYEDFPTGPWGNLANGTTTFRDDREWFLNQGLLPVATAAQQSAVADVITGRQLATDPANWLTYGTGGDNPESSLHALDQATGAGWRAGSTRIVMWFGDQPGHPAGQIPLAGAPYPGSVDTADAITALLGADIIVEAFDFANMDGQVVQVGAPPGIIDDDQATTISDATGGDYHFGWWPTANDKTVNLVATVQDALTKAMFIYEVGLDLTDVPGGLGLSVISTPASLTGSRLNGDTAFEWIIDLEALANGTYNFQIHGLVDGLIAATENDRFVVGGGNPGPGVPEPSTIALLGLGLLGVGVVARRRKK